MRFERLSAFVDPTPKALKSLKCLVLGLSFETSMETPNHRRRRRDADTAWLLFLYFQEVWFNRKVGRGSLLGTNLRRRRSECWRRGVPQLNLQSCLFINLDLLVI